MSKETSRPATLKQPKTVEVKTALPWTIILVFVAFTFGVATGWVQRSGQIVTHEEIRAEVMEQLKVETAKK